MPGLLRNTMVRNPAGRGLLGGIDWSTIGPALLSLGAGIASGGAPGGGGWGRGIGLGLAGASEAIQNQGLMDLRRAALERENQAASDTAAYRGANLSLRERELASNEAYRAAQTANLENPQAKIGETVEGIRAKLATGQPLTPGEQKVYEDVIRVDYLTRLLQGGGAAGLPNAAAPASLGVNTMEVRPDGSMEPTRPQSTGPLPFQPNANLRKLGQVYNLPDGRQALWTQDASGKVGWEVLN